MAMFVRIAEAARLLDMSEHTIRRYLADGRLQGVRFGRGHWRIPLAQLDPTVNDDDPVAAGPSVSAHHADASDDGATSG